MKWRAARLKAQGRSAREIAAELHISERKAYDLLAKARADGLPSFEPWTLAVALQRGESAPKARWLIQSGLEWDRRQADWGWTVHEVRPDLSPQFVQVIVAYYQEAETIPVLDWLFRALDLSLSISPWKDFGSAVRFYESVLSGLPAGAIPRVAAVIVLSEADLTMRRQWRAEHEEWAGSQPEVRFDADDIDDKDLALLVRERVADDVRDLQPPARGGYRPSE